MGRPILLTKELQEEIVENVKIVGYAGVAFEAAGIHRATGDRWMRLGKQHLVESHSDGTECDESCDPQLSAFRQFFLSIKKAQAESTKTDLKAISDIGKDTKNWLPHAWRAERLNPEYALRTKAEIDVKHSGEVLHKMLPAEQKTKLLAVAQKAILLEEGKDGVFEQTPQSTEE